MDGDDALEEVMLFGRDNGHYPTFDLFKAYYAIVDNYTKEVQYISDEIYVTDKYNLLVRRPQQGRHLRALHTIFKDGKFSVDEQGYKSAHHTLLRPYRMETLLAKNFKSSGK